MVDDKRLFLVGDSKSVYLQYRLARITFYATAEARTTVHPKRVSRYQVKKLHFMELMILGTPMAWASITAMACQRVATDNTALPMRRRRTCT